MKTNQKTNSKAKKADKTMNELYSGLGDVKNDFRNYNLVNLVKTYVKGKKVLDIGCGSGYLLSQIQSSIKRKGDTITGFKRDVYGIEPNQKLIEIAKKNHPTIDIRQGYGEDIQQFTEKFDTITMLDVLEHIEDDAKQVQIVKEKLNKNGRFIIVVPAYQGLYGKRDEQMGHYRRYNKESLAKLLRKNGYKIIHQRYWNMIGVPLYYFYEKILQKPLNTKLRKQGQKNIMNKTLGIWMQKIENNINMGFGLSLITIAKRK